MWTYDLATRNGVDLHINDALGYLATIFSGIQARKDFDDIQEALEDIDREFRRLAKSSGMAHPPSADHSDDFDTYEFAENYIRFALKSIEEELPKLALDYPDRLSIVDALSMVSHHMHSLARSRGMILHKEEKS